MSVQPLHKRWIDYTPYDIAKIKKERCERCGYAGCMMSFTGDGTRLYCNYLEMTGQPRLTPPDVCEHYKEDAHDIRLKFGYSR